MMKKSKRKMNGNSSSNSSESSLRSSASFDRFGDDFTQLILSYLPIDDKLRLQCLSKHFRTMSHSSQLELIFDGYLNREFGFNVVMNWYRHCAAHISTVRFKNLHSSDITDDYLDFLVANCPNLKHLNIVIIMGRQYLTALSDQTIDRFFQTFSAQLRTFETNITDPRIDKWLKQLDRQSAPNLESLVVSGDLYHNRYVGLTSFSGQHLSPDFGKQLNSLAFQLTPNCMPLFKTFVADYHKQLESLHIRLTKDFEHLSAKELITGLSQMSSVTQLKLVFERTNTEYYIIELLKQFGHTCGHQLKSLQLIAYDRTISERVLYQLVDIVGARLQHLRRLAIKCNVIIDVDDEDNDNNNSEAIDNNQCRWQLTSKSFKRLQQLTHLSLNFYGYQQIFGDFFVNITDHLPRLQCLDIDYLHRNQKTVRLIGKLPNLRTVRLYCCRNQWLEREKIYRLLKTKTNVNNIYVKYSDSPRQLFNIDNFVLISL